MDEEQRERLFQAAKKLRQGPLGPALPGVDELCKHLLASPEEPACCQEVRPLLPEVVTHEGAGEDVDNLFPEVMAHLEQCPECMELYVSLAEDLEADREVIESPAFDLSFLRQDPWQILLEVRAQIVCTEGLVIEFFRSLLQRPPEPVPVLESHTPERRLLADLVFPEVGGVEISVEVERVGDAKEGNLWVRVDSPAWKSPSGRPVRLITRSGEQIERADNYGQVVFRVSLAELDGMRIETGVGE